MNSSTAVVPSAPSTTSRFTPGDYTGKIDLVSPALFGDRPAIFLRIKSDSNQPNAQEHVTYVVRLSNPDSARIGMTEIQAAFPLIFGDCKGTKAFLKRLLERTKDLLQAPVIYSIEPQMKNGTQQRSESGEPYFNVRLRSALRDLPESLASTIADSVAKSLDDAMAAAALIKEATSFGADESKTEEASH